MRLLLLSPLPPPMGGIATWTKELVSFISHNNNWIIDIVDTSLIGKRSEKKTSKMFFIEEIKRTFSIFRRFRSAQKHNPDVVYICSSGTQFGLIRDYIMVRMSSNRPVMVHFHCNLSDQISKSKLGNWVLDKIIRQAKVLLVLNHSSYEYLRNRGASNIEIIPNFISMEKVRQSRIINSNIKTVVYVGHVRQRKGTLELIEAAKQLSSIQFYCVGPIQNEINTANIPLNVHLVGPKTSDEVIQFLMNADIFLFPSYSEGFSIAVLEAMATGLPIIATNVGANADMIGEQGGILIPIKNYNAIIKAIKNYDYNSRKKSSQYNIKKVMKDYTTDTVLTQLENIITRVKDEYCTNDH